MGTAGLVPAPASAAPTAGSNGATTTCGDSRRGAVSTTLGGVAGGILGGQVGGGDRDRAVVGAEQVDPAVGQRAVGQQGGAARRWRHPGCGRRCADAGGGDRAQPRIVDPLQGVQVGLRVRERRHAGPVGQRAQPVQPVGRRGLAGAGMRRGARLLRGAVGGVGHDVAAGHRVDGDQQVRVDGQAQRAADRAVGVDVVAGGDLGGGQQDVQAPAGGQGGGQVVVDRAGPGSCRRVRRGPAGAGRPAATAW